MGGLTAIQPSKLGQSVLQAFRMRTVQNLHIISFLAAVTVCGTTFGAIVAGQMNASDSLVLNHAIQQLLQAISSHQLAPSNELWWQRMIGDGQLLALIWLFGASVIGLPFVVVAIFLRAFSIGFSVGFTVIQFGWKGLMLATAGIFLHQIISMTVFLIAGVFAIKFSAGILRQSYPLQKLSLHFLRYTAMFLLCSVGLMTGAAVQAYLAPGVLFRLFA